MTIKDIYIASKSAGIQSANKPAKRLRAFVEDPQGEFIWPVKEEEFIITIQELEPCICAMIQSEGRQYLSKGTLHSLNRGKDDKG